VLEPSHKTQSQQASEDSNEYQLLWPRGIAAWWNPFHDATCSASEGGSTAIPGRSDSRGNDSSRREHITKPRPSPKSGQVRREPPAAPRNRPPGARKKLDRASRPGSRTEGQIKRIMLPQPQRSAPDPSGIKRHQDPGEIRARPLLNEADDPLK